MLLKKKKFLLISFFFSFSAFGDTQVVLHIIHSSLGQSSQINVPLSHEKPISAI